MDLLIYKVIHLVGLILLFSSIGSMTLRSGDGAAPKFASILHGVALVVMLVGGFGMLARMEIHWPWPSYIVAKLAIWIALGALPVLVKKRILPGALGLLVGVALGGAAAWLAIYRVELW